MGIEILITRCWGGIIYFADEDFEQMPIPTLRRQLAKECRLDSVLIFTAVHCLPIYKHVSSTGRVDGALAGRTIGDREPSRALVLESLFRL